jgi:hypothetical protein
VNFLNLLLISLASILAFVPTNGSYQDLLHAYAIPMIIAFVVAQKITSQQPQIASMSWRFLIGLTSIVFLGLICLLVWDGTDPLTATKYATGLYYLRISFGLLCVPCFTLALSSKREIGFVGFLRWFAKNLALSATPLAIIFIIGTVGVRCFSITLGCPT